MITNTFYKELGKLLYAMACVDGKVQQKEIDMLKKIVHSILVPAESNPGMDKFASSAAFFMELEFEIYSAHNINVKAAYHSFIEFVHENEKHIDEKMKVLAVSLAEKVAAAFKGINKGEMNLIQNLRDHLFPPVTVFLTAAVCLSL